jgi:hypothetical protein
MRTPYCAAIGLQRREVDEIRLSIGMEVSRLSELERHQVRVDMEMRQERSVAAAAPDVPATAYFIQMHAERSRLADNQRAIDARVTQLRAQAREVYGSLNAIEGAAQRYRDEETRRIEGIEQAAADDRSAVDFLVRVRAVRTTPGRRTA